MSSLGGSGKDFCFDKKRQNLHTQVRLSFKTFTFIATVILSMLIVQCILWFLFYVLYIDIKQV